MRLGVPLGSRRRLGFRESSNRREKLGGLLRGWSLAIGHWSLVLRKGAA